MQYKYNNIFWDIFIENSVNITNISFHKLNFFVNICLFWISRWQRISNVLFPLKDSTWELIHYRGGNRACMHFLQKGSPITGLLRPWPCWTLTHLWLRIEQNRGWRKNQSTSVLHVDRLIGYRLRVWVRKGHSLKDQPITNKDGARFTILWDKNEKR